MEKTEVKMIIHDVIIECAKVVYENPRNCITSQQIQILSIEDKLVEKWTKKDSDWTKLSAYEELSKYTNELEKKYNDLIDQLTQ